MYVKRSEIALILTDLWLRLPVSSFSLYMGITSAVFHMVGITLRLALQTETAKKRLYLYGPASTVLVRPHQDHNQYRTKTFITR